MKLTLEDAHFLFRVDLNTGVLCWNIDRRRARRGQVAGTLDTSTGYLVVTVNYRKYSVHEIIWLLVHGSWANSHIDHIDRSKLNNKPNNLRLATSRENKLNSPTSDNAVGCYWDNKNQNWRVAIRYEGSLLNLGSFITLLDARAHYLRRRALLFSY